MFYFYVESFSTEKLMLGMAKRKVKKNLRVMTWENYLLIVMILMIYLQSWAQDVVAQIIRASGSCIKCTTTCMLILEEKNRSTRGKPSKDKRDQLPTPLTWSKPKNSVRTGLTIGKRQRANRIPYPFSPPRPRQFSMATPSSLYFPKSFFQVFFELNIRELNLLTRVL